MPAGLQERTCLARQHRDLLHPGAAPPGQGERAGRPGTIRSSAGCFRDHRRGPSLSPGDAPRCPLWRRVPRRGFLCLPGRCRSGLASADSRVEGSLQPKAEALHKRVVHPSKRREVAAVLNYHSVKNRFLLRLKNMDGAVWRRCFPYMWLRDLSVISYVGLFEHSSWPAFAAVRRLRPRFAEKRRDLMSRRRSTPAEIAAWFAFRPVARDLETS